MYKSVALSIVLLLSTGCATHVVAAVRSVRATCTVIPATAEQAEALESASREWNAALGWEALRVATPGAECTFACIRVSIDDTPLGVNALAVTNGHVADAAISILPTVANSTKILAHELGHALIGNWHSDDKLDLMYPSTAPDGSGFVVVSGEDVERVEATWAGVGSTPE